MNTRRRREPERADTASSTRAVQRCLLCRGVVERECEGRFVTTCCLECRAVLRIEFDPADDPTLRARIERLDDDDDMGRDEPWRNQPTLTAGAAQSQNR